MGNIMEIKRKNIALDN